MRFIRFLGSIIVVVGLVWGAKYLYFKPKFKVGVDAPDFNFTDLEGQELQLSDFKGQYVLIDFWGSWCGPCRQQNPQIRQLYDRYHQVAFKDATGFEVISIGIETNRAQWEQAIRRDELDWSNHFTDAERFQSPIARKYGVREIPTKYLVNPDGKIVAVNPDIEFIRTFFDRRMAS
ncbi:MAG: TlpA family protein disulfide reductase [Saprospiraceae bacterium]|nr:TlpA family protein disulfide reductase [Saprospiraceae bacterium]